MLTVQWAQDLAEENFTVIGISPGVSLSSLLLATRAPNSPDCCADVMQWLKTDMGSEHADLPVDVGVKEVIRIMTSSGPESTGKFLNIHVPGWENAAGPNRYDGKEPPW